MELTELQALALTHKNINILGLKAHSKASEAYVHVSFKYEDEVWEGWIPYVYRRAGLEIDTPNELIDHLVSVYPKMRKNIRLKWYEAEKKDWELNHKDKAVTKPYFDAMASGEWACRKCVDKLTNSSNNARRIQDIKEMGYSMATDTKRYCPQCGTNTTHDLLTPIDKAEATGYETWSPQLRNRILNVLEHYDSYEDRIVAKSTHLIPDHKFPEIRWDDKTLEENKDDMKDSEIRNKFQLLSNQRNLQKREVCRGCYQTGKRGILYGVKYFYKGDENWPSDIPKRGKASEIGCEGCGWYDLKTWRTSINEKLHANF
jgi:hypothetical protein